MEKLDVIVAPRAQKDLGKIPPDVALGIIRDFKILEVSPWPGPPKVKRLTGCPYWRLRTGDYRSFFVRDGRRVIILRVVNRKDAEKAIKVIK